MDGRAAPVGAGRQGQTQAAWAAAGGCTPSMVGEAAQGRRRITRQMAYYFTRAAVRLGVPLPPEGRIGPKRRAPRPFPPGRRGPQGGRVWRPEELAVLGTVPDREAAARLDRRSRVAVERMRRELGIPRVRARGWDGRPRPCPVPYDEVLRRYYTRLGMAPPAAGQGVPAGAPGDVLPVGGDAG